MVQKEAMSVGSFMSSWQLHTVLISDLGFWCVCVGGDIDVHCFHSHAESILLLFTFMFYL